LGLLDEAVALDIDACMTWVIRYVEKRDRQDHQRLKTDRYLNQELAVWIGYTLNGQRLPPLDEGHG